MDPNTELVYLQELLTQINNAFVYIDRMNQTLEKSADMSSEVSAKDFFREARGFLQTASSVSRMLWPPGSGTAEDRADHLKSVLSVEEDNSLADRELRNHLVHYDERLDTWAADGDHTNVVSRNIGPPPSEMVEGMEFEDEEIFTNYVPEENVLIFWGEEYDVQEIADALNELVGKIQERRSNLR